MGRIDRQLKVRGKLIAPEEIEGAYRDAPGVKRAAVLARSTPTGSRLYAFLEADGRRTLGDYAAHLADRLPRWMIPWEGELREALPMTSSGKVDLQRLRAEGLPGSGGGAPRGFPEGHRGLRPPLRKRRPGAEPPEAERVHRGLRCTIQ